MILFTRADADLYMKRVCNTQFDGYIVWQVSKRYIEILWSGSYTADPSGPVDHVCPFRFMDVDTHIITHLLLSYIIRYLLCYCIYIYVPFIYSTVPSIMCILPFQGDITLGKLYICI